jgi:hypothetical protein
LENADFLIKYVAPLAKCHVMLNRQAFIIRKGVEDINALRDEYCQKSILLYVEQSRYFSDF